MAETYYTAYGLTIRSAFDLPELPLTRHPDAVDVIVTEGNLDSIERSGKDDPSRRIRATADVCRMTYDNLGTFLVEREGNITCDVASSDLTTQKVFRRILENEVLGVLLHLRGLLVLHASAVAIDGKAIVFLGPRGAGKSTTAAAFHATGHTVLEDDVVAVRITGGEISVTQGVPQLRLMPDAADALGFDGATQPDDDLGKPKRYEKVSPVTGSMPLVRCYVLDEGDTVDVKPIPGRKGLLDIVAATYAYGLLEDTDATVNHFQQCVTLAQKTPICRLQRPKDHTRLSELVECVVEAL